MMKTGAKNRGHVFEVTIEYLWELFVAQGGLCALTGACLALTKKTLRPGDSVASLDRINSSVGYVPGNVQWVHPTINFMKHAMPQEQFIEWCVRVAAYKGGG
jgi:hypothetical protein